MAVDSTYNRTVSAPVPEVPAETGQETAAASSVATPTKTATPVRVVKVRPRVSKVKFTTDAIGVWRSDAPEMHSAVKAAADSTLSREARPDSIAADSVAADTVPVRYGMVLVDPVIRENPVTKPSAFGGEGMSWVFLALGLLFCAVALKFKNNVKYLRALIKDLTDVRVRQNVFDETVQESTFLLLLNVLWVFCAGVLLWQTVRLTGPDNPIYSMSIPDRAAPGVLICTGITALYSIGMFLAYLVVGNVFSDSARTRMWLKGNAASLGIQVFIFFPLALVTLCYAPWIPVILWIAAGVFVLGKIVFIYKGFRIFFNEISSWMLFLYYLCSLEIVPLILTYLAALFLCGQWL